jgi:hypothetical protein
MASNSTLTPLRTVATCAACSASIVGDAVVTMVAFVGVLVGDRVGSRIISVVAGVVGANVVELSRDGASVELISGEGTVVGTTVALVVGAKVALVVGAKVALVVGAKVALLVTGKVVLLVNVAFPDSAPLLSSGPGSYSYSFRNLVVMYSALCSPLAWLTARALALQQQHTSNTARDTDFIILVMVGVSDPLTQSSYKADSHACDTLLANSAKDER